MYQKLTPLKLGEHAELRLKPISDYSFARSQLTVPIVIDELADVAREYLIIFPTGGKLPVALLGIQKDANAYVSESGAWRAAYIPANIRQYPMALTRIPESAAVGDVADASEPRFAVLIDVDSPMVSQEEGDPVFEESGALGAVAEQKTQLLNTLQSRAVVTQRLVQAIDDAGLLVERTIRIKAEGEEDRQVTGLRVIDETALNALDGAAFNTLRASGALPLIYASLLSGANFRRGPIGMSQMFPKVEPKSDLIDAIMN